MRLSIAAILAALVTSVLVASAAVSQDEPPKMPDNSAEMKRVEWLRGRWVGGGDYPNYGKCDFEYRISWMKNPDKSTNRNFLSAAYTMRAGGNVIWADHGMIGWDKDRKRYTWFVFGMDGTIGTSYATKTKFAKNGDVEKLVLDGETTGSSPWKKFRVVLLRVDKDTLVQEMLTYKDGKYVPMDMAKSTFKRKPLPVPAKAGDGKGTSTKS